MDSFEAKIGQGRMRKRENTNYSSVPFLTDPKQKIKKKKLKDTIMALFQAQIGWKRPRKSENKNYRLVSFLPEA